MHQTLRDAHEEQVGRILCVVGRQLPQHRRQPCIVGTGAYQAEGEDRVESDVRVVIVAVFVQYVQDHRLGVRQGGQGHREGHGASRRRRTVSSYLDRVNHHRMIIAMNRNEKL